MKDEIKNLKQSQLHKLRVQVEHLKNDIKFWHEKYEKNLPYEKTIDKKDRQIAELEKENKELKTGLKRISDKLDVVKKDWREHESLDKLREQKLANRDKEWIEKVEELNEKFAGLVYSFAPILGRPYSEISEQQKELSYRPMAKKIIDLIKSEMGVKG